MSLAPKHITIWAMTVGLVVTVAASAQRPGLAPTVSIWYRGTPAGVPQEDDLAQIRAAGFGGVTWPVALSAQAADLERMATRVGLTVTVRAPAAPLTPTSALMPNDAVDVPVGKLTVDDVDPLVWRAVGHGARQVAFDSGAPAGTGLVDSRGVAASWVAHAAAIERQFMFNRVLFESLGRAPAVTIDPPVPVGLDIASLQTDRSWFIVATNTSSVPVNTVVHLAAGTPYALWVNLLDNSPLAMIRESSGAKWDAALEAHAARIYFIDKVLK